MSTLSEREAALRRALQNAAASIDPAPDGLQRIQARLRRPRPTAIAWLEAACTDFYLRARAGLQTAGPVVADDMRHIWERFGPSSGSARGRGRLLRWLRPLAALSLAAFVFGAGTYVGLNSSALFPSAPSLNSGTVGPGGSNSGGHGSQGPDGSGSPVGSPGASGSSTSPSGCKKHHTGGQYKPEPSSSASGSTTPTSSGSPSATITPASPTPTPTPSSSSSTTPDPAGTTSTTGGSTAGTAGPAGTGQAGTTVGSRAADTATSHAGTTTQDSSGHQSKASSQVSPSTTSSANPCATKTTAAIRPPEVVPPGAVGSTTGASAQLMAAKLGATGAALV